MSPVARVLISVAALTGASAQDSPFLEDDAPAAPTREILFFMASWCGPCDRVEPVVLKLAKEGVKIRTIDVDLERDVATRYQVSGIPAFVAISEGREVGRLVGMQSEETLRRFAANLEDPACPLPPPVPAAEIPGAIRVEPLLRATYPIEKEKAEALVAFMKAQSKVEFEFAVGDGSLRVTAPGEPQRALGAFIREVLAERSVVEPKDGTERED